MNKIFAFFSSRLASIACLVIAIVSRIVNVCFLSYAGRDKMFLVMQSKSLLDGKGLGIPEYFTTNPDIPVYDYTPMWPPGYPVLLAPFLKIFNYDIYWATTMLDIIACIGLIFIIRKIFMQLGFSIIAVNLMTLVAGCFEYSFINDSKPTDNVPIVIFLLGISLIIKVVSSDRFSFAAVLITAFVLFLPSLFRYSYPPLSIAVTFSVLLTGFLKKENLLKKKGAWLFASNVLLTALFFLAMKSVTGYAGYAVPTARGYFPENLAHWYPVVPSSFMNFIFLTSQALHVAGLSVETVMKILEVINVVAVFSLTIVFLLLFFSRKFLAVLTPFKWFIITGFFASAATFVSLGYLSFTYEAQTWVPSWSYVGDHRYYAFPVVFIQMTFLGWIFSDRNFFKNVFLKVIAILCGVVLFIEVAHNIYFNTKVAFNFKKYKSEVYREQDYVYFVKLIGELEKKYPGYEIWAAAPGDGFYPYTAVYYGHTGIADAEKFKNNTVSVKRKTILAIMLYDDEVPLYNEFLSRSKILLTNKIHYSYYYVIELLP
ncbi:MAG TPA: hypothetical protein VFT15_16595 [Chitinophagaceae bacterium]|nr:hypothetical protein [Chitinophagaceae bacterium]